VKLRSGKRRDEFANFFEGDGVRDNNFRAYRRVHDYKKTRRNSPSHVSGGETHGPEGGNRSEVASSSSKARIILLEEGGGGIPEWAPLPVGLGKEMKLPFA